METLQAKIERLNAELAEINQKESFNQDDIDRRNQITNEISDAEYKMKQEHERQQIQEQKHEELQEIVRGHNFNEVLGHPDANKIIHRLLYEESIKYEDMLAVKDAEIKRLNDELLASQEREANLEHQNKSLQEAATGQEELKAKYEDAMKDSRYHMNESNRLQAKVRELEYKLEEAEKQRKEFTPSGSLVEMVASAKAETEKKRQLMNIRQVDRANYVGTDEQGNEVKVNWLELPKIEAVSQFRLPDEIPQIAVDPDATQQEVNQFQSETQDTSVPGETSGAASGEVAGPATIEEIDARLKRVEAQLGIAV